jgi:dipeptidyl aminopeptidase/acylaminoacyl peptidase
MALEQAALQQNQPGSGLLVDAQEYSVSPCGRWAAFTASLFDQPQGLPQTKIGTINLSSGSVQLRTAGSGSDRCARWSPDGRTIAFLSDRAAPGLFQLQLLDTGSWTSRAGPVVDGFVETLEWSADSRRLLLGVAGPGADLAGAQGGVTSALAKSALPDWMPQVNAGPSDNEWRRAWVAELTGVPSAKPVSPRSLNVWESCWCGPDAVAAVASDAPDEAAWYRATVQRFDLDGSAATTLYAPRHHLGGLVASASGHHVAVIEAICSDRTIVAGDIVWMADGSAPRKLDSAGVDVNHLRFAGEDTLIFAGHRSCETALGRVQPARNHCELHWSASDRTFGGPRYPEFAPLPDGLVLTTVEGFLQQPAIALLSPGNGTQVLATLGNPALAPALDALVASAQALRWQAPDGQEIHGWLLLPKTAGAGPWPLVMEVHGGPVWQFRQRWLGSSLMRRELLARGYALVLPNPRGSSGRGQAYASQVFGDMGGADTHDFLSCVDHLVAQGTADQRNLFVTGGSYGG